MPATLAPIFGRNTSPKGNMMLKHALFVFTLLSLVGCGAFHGSAWSPPSNSVTSQSLDRASAPGPGALLNSNNFTKSFAIPTSMGFPWFEALGSDGNVWFTEQNAANIGRITPAGVIKEFHIPSGTAAVGIAAGSAGLLWFANGTKIGRITTAGAITEFSLPTGAHNAIEIAKGPDGNMWFTDRSGNAVGRITPAGVIKEFSVPTHGANPQGIAAGADGNLWFTEALAVPSKVGKITTAGVITEFTVPTHNSTPNAIVNGPDGNLYIGESSAANLARVTTAGVITEFATPSGAIHALGVGPDGQIWLTFAQTGRLSEFNTTTHAFAASVLIPHGPLSVGLSLVQGSDGDMWLGTSHNEIDVYEENIAPVGVRLIGESSTTDPNYGFILGYFNGTTSTTSQVVHLTMGESVQFMNVDASLPHTVSFLGNATSTHAPWPASFNGSSTQSPAGTAIGTTNFSTGALNPGQLSLVYETGLPGFYMVGCAFHYNSNTMRTVIIVQ
jgi:streptogramin lyase/plastocyanin